MNWSLWQAELDKNGVLSNTTKSFRNITNSFSNIINQIIDTTIEFPEIIEKNMA